MKEKKQSKRYIIIFGIVALLGLTGIAGLTFIIDPFFQYHKLCDEREVYDERYQNPGLAKNAYYDAVIVGSSMSENFNCEWFDEAYDINALKLTFSGGSAQDWVNAVILAEENQNVRYVFGNIDISVLGQEYGKVRYELPQYLYDNNFLNDVYYLLNKEILFSHTMKLIEYKGNGNLKNAYAWYDNQKESFGHKNVLSLVDYKGDCNNIEQKKIMIDENTRKTVEQIKETIQKYPDTKFKIFYSPYSIMDYYCYAVAGNINTVLEVYEYSMNELLECENCELYFPTYNNIEMITDLDSYKDLNHYDIDIQYTIFEEMRDGVNRVTKENYREIIQWFRNEIINYDYDELYKSYND